MNLILLRSIFLATCLLSLISFTSCKETITGPAMDVEINSEVYYLSYKGVNSASTDATKIIMEKLKELKFISSYKISDATALIPSALSVSCFPMTFKRENVDYNDIERVKAELITEAQKHYDKALADVKAVDFSKLVNPTQDMEIIINMGYQYGGKPYNINIKVAHPAAE